MRVLKLNRFFLFLFFKKRKAVYMQDDEFKMFMLEQEKKTTSFSWLRWVKKINFI